ncbi:MAG: GHKL domain-containing protein [Calditrichaeota bacterium]|nr:GHKL domain-containing protein [Calditrichota bacterium]
MDSGGRLLFHSHHSEMVLRSIENDSADCMECHSSFDWQKRMLTSEAAFGEYTVGNEPRKIMSHITLQIHNARWMLVISSNLSDVTAVLRSKFSLFFVLVIFILAFIVITAIYFYQMNLKRIQAEEAEKLSQQKELLHLQACQASKLASVGELVDAVAHEINTPVSIIMTQADALFLKMKEDQNIFREEIEIIKKQVQRVRYYTHRLLNYSKSMPFEPKQINLSRLLDECLFLLAPRFRASSIKIIKNYAPHSLNISADRRQIEQVFINILNNAVDAIGRNGEIKLETRISNRDDSNGMEIIISDTGEGISPENLPHIFETFYSTKFAARGTGLGLSISKAIIQRHHGKISVISERGVGTTFNVFLPVNSNNGSEL